MKIKYEQEFVSKISTKHITIDGNDSIENVIQIKPHISACKHVFLNIYKIQIRFQPLIKRLWRQLWCYIIGLLTAAVSIYRYMYVC